MDIFSDEQGELNGISITLTRDGIQVTTTEDGKTKFKEKLKICYL